MGDPAFLFYPSDFLIGTADLSNEETGQYIRLLSYMHQKGRLSEETIRLLVGSVSDRLRAKFDIDKNGNFYNKRLEFEIKKRQNFINSRRKNGALGGRPVVGKSPKKENNKTHQKDNNHMVNGRLTYEKPTENLIENENIYINNKSITKKDKLKDIENNINNIQRDFPEIDVKYEYGVFVDYLESRDKRYKNYNAAFRNWLRNPSFPKKPLPPKILKNRCPVEKGMAFLATEKTPACPKCSGKLELYALMEGQLYQEQIYNICWWCPDCGEIFAVAEASYPPEWKERLERENGH